MKRALITGVTGQDGSYLAELLLEKGYDVHGMIRRSSVDYRERIAHLEGKEHFHLHYGDLSDSMSLMALVLVGQTELWDKLRMQRYAAVRQRIDINCVLPHLDRAETEKYIVSHLAYAGGKQEIFTDKAIDDIYKESTGIPRSINRICEKSLMYASQQNKRLIDEHLVHYIIEHELLGGDVHQ